MKIKHLLLLIPLFAIIISCNTTEPPPPLNGTKPTLTLALEDVSCTEAWLTLTTKDLVLPAELTLKQYNQSGDSISQIFVLNTQDSLLYIDSLLPNQTYKFIATMQQLNNRSNELSVITMDTTSHNFTWQTWEFGQHSSSVLYDVAIIDENNIWAVGEIFMNDSLGNPDPIAYNAAYWNGSEWELKRIKTKACDGVDYPSIKTIFAFSIDDILFSHLDGSITHFNGIEFTNDCSLIIQLNGSANKIWGISKNDFYVVSVSGFIAHYDGSQWTKIESGTTLHLTDIYGDNKGNIYAAGVDIPSIKGVVVKNSTPNIWNVMIEGEVIDKTQLFSKLFGSFGAIWIDEIGTVYTGGNLMYEYKNKKWNYVTSLPENFMGGNPGTYYRGFINSIYGNSSNDILIAGDRNTLKHFNGITWVQIGLPYSPSSSIIWSRVKMKSNLVVAVGEEGIQAKIIMLKR